MIARLRIRVAMFDEQPVGVLAAEAVALHAHQNPTAVQLVALEDDFQITCCERLFGGLVAFRGPESPVPELHGAAAVLAMGNSPFEVPIRQRVVLYFHGKALFGRVQRGTAGHGP